MPSKYDADDILQEIYLTAQIKFHTLREKTLFKSWLLAIARNKCNEYFRNRAKILDIPLDEIVERRLSYAVQEHAEDSYVCETFAKLKDKEKQILSFYYFQDFSYMDIARKLGIPEGTVKSRLHSAKMHFKKEYSYFQKGENVMKNLPEYLPEYTIELLDKEPFSVRHEELPGMLIIPRKNEKLSFGMYDQPKRKRTGSYHLQVKGEVIIHGVHGVEIQLKYIGENEPNEERVIYAQLTNDFCRYLGGVSVNGNVKSIITFLDDAFVDAYNIGENNCGFAVEREQTGKILLKDGELITERCGDVSDIVGRYTVTIDGKSYDTVRLINLETSGNSYMMSEYYLNEQGRTILWRRFNKDDWAIERYKSRWSELLPKNERLLINGMLYVHWYDCITDYIL